MMGDWKVSWPSIKRELILSLVPIAFRAATEYRMAGGYESKEKVMDKEIDGIFKLAEKVSRRLDEREGGAE